MITRSEEFTRGREFAAYEAFIGAVRAYADATHHNALITPESVAKAASRTYELECERVHLHQRIAASIREDATRNADDRHRGSAA